MQPGSQTKPDFFENAIWAGIPAILMIGYGWGSGGWAIPADAGALYEAFVDLVDWTLKIGGICLGGVTIVYLSGRRVGLLLEALVAGVCGIVFVVCPLYWTLNDGLGLQYMLFIVFGGLFINAARGCWVSYRGSAAPPAFAGTGGAPNAAGPAPASTPAHPASVHPETLPKEGEPEPEEGYLAALSKEIEEPPGASYE